MGIRRRIEITAFRRATIIFRDQSGDASKRYSPPESKRSEPRATDSAQAGEVDPAEAQPTTVDVARSPELRLLIEALVKNDGDSDSAASQLNLSRSDFISKLRGLGFSIK